MTLRSPGGMLWSPRIWVDFMARDQSGRVPLDFPATVADLNANSVDLFTGMRLVLYTDDATDAADPDDLVTIGNVEFDSATRRWWARYDWQDLVHASSLDEMDRTEYQKFRPQTR